MAKLNHDLCPNLGRMCVKGRQRTIVIVALFVVQCTTCTFVTANNCNVHERKCNKILLKIVVKKVDNRTLINGLCQ